MKKILTVFILPDEKLKCYEYEKCVSNTYVTITKESRTGVVRVKCRDCLFIDEKYLYQRQR